MNIVVNTASADKIKNDKKNSSNSGYFQYSYRRILEIACNPDLGINCVLSYLVLAGGVNGDDEENPRASRHWKRSVNKRTGLSESLAEVAIEKLVGQGYIEKLDKENPNDMFYYTCRVDPKYDVDLSCLSQKIFHSLEDSKDKGSKGSLRFFYKRISLRKKRISVDQQRLDAVMLFLALHENQDYFKFSGIDPKIVNSQFDRVDPSFLDGWPESIPIPGTEDWSLNHVRARPDEKFWSQDFSHRVFSCLPGFNEDIRIQDRLEIAFDNLIKADLLYSAHVLWSDDPLNQLNSVQAMPLYVVYVENSKSSDFEISLHESIKKATIDTNTLEAKQIYGGGNKEDYLYLDNHFGYMVDGVDAETALMLTVYRARWWASDANTMQSIQACADRTLEAKNTLDSVVELTLNGEYLI